VAVRQHLACGFLAAEGGCPTFCSRQKNGQEMKIGRQWSFRK